MPDAALICRVSVVILVARVSAEKVIGGNLDQDDAEPVGSSIHIAIRPHGSVAGLPKTLRALQG